MAKQTKTKSKTKKNSKKDSKKNSKSNSKTETKTKSNNTQSKTKIVKASSSKSKLDVIGDNNSITVDDVYRLTDLPFSEFPWQYRHLHNSFNSFVDSTVPDFLTDNEHVFHEIATETKIIRHRFDFANIVVIPPKLANDNDPQFPDVARKKQKSYQLKAYADITQIRDVIDVTSSGKSKITSTVVGHTTSGYHFITIPVMVKSKWCNTHIYPEVDTDECAYDPGGYFIINGSEKIVICQDKMLSNHPLVFTRKASNNVFNVVQVNSKSKNIGDITQTVSIKMKNDRNMVLKFPVLNEINPIVLFKALGVVAEGEIIDYCVGDKSDIAMVNILKVSIRNCVNDNYDTNIPINTQDEAMDYLITKMRVFRSVSAHYSQTDQTKRLEQKKMSLMELLKKSFLPHIEGNYTEPYREKAMYLGYMINRLLQVELGRRPVDDRDSYLNKRVDNINELLFEIFIQRYKVILNDCKKAYKSWMKDKDVMDEPYNTIHNIKPQEFESGFKSALMQGTWPRAKGVSQMLQRLSYMQLLTFLSRIDSPSGSQSGSKLTSPRQVHYSSVPFLDSAQTPEHAKVGLIKHLSLLGSITIGDRDNYEVVREYIINHPSVNKLSHVKSHELKYMYKVILNGEWIGLIQNVYTDNVNECIEFYKKAKEMKISGLFDPEMTSVVFDIETREIRFNTDSGRLYRPVFRVSHDNELIITKEMISKINLRNGDKWHDFYSKKPYPIEFIDTEEQPYCMVAYSIDQLKKNRQIIEETMNYKFDGQEDKVQNRYGDKSFIRYDYCEFHPSLLLGEIICNVPFAERNPGTRNMFQYAQGKQAMGIYCTVYRARTDKSFILYRPEVPLTSTRTSKYTYTDILPPGQNAMVAISTYTGYNQEDSLIFNKNSIDRGFMWSMSLTKVTAEISKDKQTTSSDKFGKPSPENTLGMQRANYSKLNKSGFAPEETELFNDDVIFGKMTPIDAPDTNIMYKDSSELYKNNSRGVVDRVYTGIENTDGNEMVKASVRIERTPKGGDKYCCYLPMHQVLTTEGWVPIEEITLQHKVASLVDGKTLKYVNPTAVQEYDHDGEIYVIDSNQVSLKVTKNHRMYVGNRDGKNYKIKLAEDCYGKRYKCLKNVENVEMDINDRPKELKFDEDGNVTHFIVYEAKPVVKIKAKTDDKAKTKGKKTNTKTKTKTKAKKVKDQVEEVEQQEEVEEITDDVKTTKTKKTKVTKTKKTKATKNTKVKTKANVKKVTKTKDTKTKANDKKVTKTKAKDNDKKTKDKKTKGPKVIYEFDIDSWLIFFGIWIAEGSIASNGKSVSFAANKQRVKDALTECADTMKLKFSKYKDQTFATEANNWNFYNPTLAAYLTPYKHSLNKHLPDWVWYLNVEQSRKLIEGMMLGDGHKMKGTVTKRYDTSSVKLKDQLQRLALHAGWAANSSIKYEKGHVAIMKTQYGKKLDKPVEIKASVDAHRLTIVTKQLKPIINKNIVRSTNTGGNDRYEDYTGKVYCCTVPGDGIIYVKRDGKPVWCGQSRYGQKGTIGIPLSQEDMPHNRHGISPDIIMNPQAFPSRMTIGQLNETIGSKVGALGGHFVDGTAFTGIDIEDLSDMLEELGYHRSGEEYMYNGMTGQRMKTRIMFAPTFYQRLKHMVEDKMHSRAKGRKTVLTRQAAEGRARDGGLRLGEMERDALVAHGVVMFLNQKHMFDSDIYSTFVCGDCGVFANREPQIDSRDVPGRDDVYYCPICRKYDDIHQIVIPYAFKLMVQELQAMSILARIKVKKTEPKVSAKYLDNQTES